MDIFLLYINAIVCTGIAARVFFFSTIGHRKKMIYSVLSWGLFWISSSVAVRCFMGEVIGRITIEEVCLHGFILFALMTRRGNVCRFLTPRKSFS